MPITPEEPLAAAEAAEATPARAQRQSIWRVLGHRDYALLFFGELVSAAGTQIMIVALAWQVYKLSNSVTDGAIALGTVGLLQAIPRLLFSLVGGVIADAFDRRKLLLIIEIALGVFSAILAITTALNIINIAIIYVIVLLSACVSSFEFPTRNAIIPTLVPRRQLTDAVSLGMVGFQLTVVLGATAGGFVLAWVGIANTYWIDAISYLVVVAALLVMTVPRIAPEKRAQPGFAALRDGILFLRAHPIILAVLSLDFVANFFGSPRSLLPIYADSILHVGAEGLGILQAGVSIGAVVLTPLTGAINRLPRQGIGVLLAIIAWGICMSLFGITGGPLWLAVFWLAAAGAADMVSMVLRGVIIQTTTPDEFRGRMSAVNGMFVIGGPMLGQFESGVVAGFTTPQFAVVSGGVVCIIAALLIAARVPRLLSVSVE